VDELVPDDNQHPKKKVLEEGGEEGERSGCHFEEEGNHPKQPRMGGVFVSDI